MWLRLRQIAFVAQKLEPVEEALIDILGLQVCFRDPGVGVFGLHNALFPVGNQFIEVVAPNDLNEDTAGGRYLSRRDGDGGYMVITQCDDQAPRRVRLDNLGVRLVTDYQGSSFVNMQLHPRDTGGSFFEIDEMLGPHAHEVDGPWHPAGPDWQKAKTERVSAIVAATMQCDNPSIVARRWAEISELPLDGTSLALENASLNFVPCVDGRPEGLSELDILGDVDTILDAADKHGLRTRETQVSICGVRLNIVRKTGRR